MAVVDLVLADPPSSVSLTTATTLLSLSLRSPSYSLFLSPPLPPPLPLCVFCTEEYLDLSLLPFFFFFWFLFFSIFLSIAYTSSSPLSLSAPNRLSVSVLF